MRLLAKVAEVFRSALQAPIRLQAMTRKRSCFRRYSVTIRANSSNASIQVLIRQEGGGAPEPIFLLPGTPRASSVNARFATRRLAA
jgi:hypothetical protein